MNNNQTYLDERTEARIRQYLVHRSVEVNQPPQTLGTSIVVYYFALNWLESKLRNARAQGLSIDPQLDYLLSLPYGVEPEQFKKAVLSMESPAGPYAQSLATELFDVQGIQNQRLLRSAENFIAQQAHKNKITPAQCIAKIVLADEFLLTALEDISLGEELDS